MDYFENTPLFEPSLLSEILKLKKSERHEFINPLILPEIMRNVLREYFYHEKYHILSWDYFTAKNVVTGNIEVTENTFTIHHFAAQYHSREWLEARALKQKIFARFDSRSLFVKIVIKAISLIQRIEEGGLGKTFRYSVNKYIFRKNTRGGVVEK
jgi:hypothetical protein